MAVSIRSSTDGFPVLRDAIAGLVAVALIIFCQQLVGPASSLGISKTTAIWVIVPLGEIVSLLFLATYLRSVDFSPWSFIGSFDFRW